MRANTKTVTAKNFIFIQIDDSLCKNRSMSVLMVVRLWRALSSTKAYFSGVSPVFLAEEGVSRGG
jgi:hypothetical protein